ncbi:MAG TPA: ABC-type transport auxiliary lipoprotein family protein [Alphaproteobacteria bacterium]|jgi:cholesterol transport system auxiliary component|nr:ABC-type transport auxiliary lipoprotein family protein [Alphaproteobacteria bacterium]
MTRRVGMNYRARAARPVAIFAAAALGALAAGCGSVIPGADVAPPKLYSLTPKNTFSADLPKVTWQLVVEQPDAAASLNTTRIALRQTPITLDYYARAVWTDTAPRLFQTKIIESFENSKKIISVGRDAVGLRSDYVLKCELRHFEALYFQGGMPIVYVELNAKLVKMPERVIIANQTWSRKITSTSPSLDDVVLAFDDASGKILKRLVEWALVAPSRPGLAMPEDTGD